MKQVLVQVQDTARDLLHNLPTNLIKPPLPKILIVIKMHFISVRSVRFLLLRKTQLSAKGQPLG